MEQRPLTREALLAAFKNRCNYDTIEPSLFQLGAHIRTIFEHLDVVPLPEIFTSTDDILECILEIEDPGIKKKAIDEALSALVNLNDKTPVPYFNLLSQAEEKELNFSDQRSHLKKMSLTPSPGRAAYAISYVFKQWEHSEAAAEFLYWCIDKCGYTFIGKLAKLARAEKDYFKVARVCNMVVIERLTAHAQQSFKQGHHNTSPEKHLNMFDLDDVFKMLRNPSLQVLSITTEQMEYTHTALNAQTGKFNTLLANSFEDGALDVNRLPRNDRIS